MIVHLHTALELFVWGFVLHNIADWFFQNWMAQNKANRRVDPERGINVQIERWLDNKIIIHSHWWDRHPAAWIHSGIHTVILLLIFPWYAALAIGFIHLIIDSRTILTRWKQFFRQSIEGDVALHVAIWQDQVAHWCVLALFALLVA